MTKRILIVLLLLSSALTYAAQGYWRGGEYVQMLQVDGMTKYVETADNMYQKIARRVRANGYVVSSTLGVVTTYTSPLYRTRECDSLFVLPKILVSFATKADSVRLLAPLRPMLKTIVSRKDYLAVELNVVNSDKVLQIASSLATESGVVWCEPDLLQRRVLHNSLFANQYYLHNTGQNGGTSGMDINVVPAWDMVVGSPNITVAVIDTGCDPSHPDLAANMLSGYTVGGFAGNGIPVNVNSGKKAHGTACAGIVGAIDNSIGIKGVASGVKILPVNIFPQNVTVSNASGYLSDDETAEAISWAAARADVLSCSWGGGDEATSINNAIQTATTSGRNGKGCIVVCSAGNDGNDSSVGYPANLPTTLSAGAIYKNGAICDYSQTGSLLDVVAFGGPVPGDICTTDISGTNGYEAGDYMSRFNGTSAACPQVAGVAALILSANSDLTETQVRAIIKGTARDLGASGRDDTYGYGLVDAAAAVRWATIQGGYMQGPDVVEDNAAYTACQFPPTATVQCSFVPEPISAGSPSRIAYNTTDGTVSVSNTGHTAFIGDLRLSATLPVAGAPVHTFRRNISGDGPFSGMYFEVRPDGTVTGDAPMVDDEYDWNLAYPASTVVMTSPNFRYRNVTYTSPAGSGYRMERDGKIMFEMPQLAEGERLTFTISGGGVSSVLHFKFGVPNSYYNSRAQRVVKALQGQTLRVRASGGERAAQVNGMIDNPKY